MNERYTDTVLRQKASRLKLTFIRDHLSDIIDAIVQGQMGPRETLDYVLTKECDQRDANRCKQSMQGAHFPSLKTLEGFDFSKQPSINPGIVRELKKMEWLETGENVALFGAPGVGKTHLAIGFGRLAVEHGYSVRFYSAVNLIAQLEKAVREDSLEIKLKELMRPNLLIIDEIGYLPYTPEAARLFFLLVSKRYERKSILTTSNRAPSEWGLIFADATATTAILDRLLHHCTVLTILGGSYRLLEQKRAGMKLKKAIAEVGVKQTASPDKKDGTDTKH